MKHIELKQEGSFALLNCSVLDGGEWQRSSLVHLLFSGRKKINQFLYKFIFPLQFVARQTYILFKVLGFVCLSGQPDKKFS